MPGFYPENNTPLQTDSEVRVLQKILSSVQTGTSAEAGVQLVPAASVVSASGTVAAGKRSISFVPSSDFTGTLLGEAWPLTNSAVTLEAGADDTLGAVVYTRTTGSLTIFTLTPP